MSIENSLNPGKTNENPLEREKKYLNAIIESINDYPDFKNVPRCDRKDRKQAFMTEMAFYLKLQKNKSLENHFKMKYDEQPKELVENFYDRIVQFLAWHEKEIQKYL